MNFLFKLTEFPVQRADNILKPLSIKIKSNGKGFKFPRKLRFAFYSQLISKRQNFVYNCQKTTTASKSSSPVAFVVNDVIDLFIWI